MRRANVSAADDTGAFAAGDFFGAKISVEAFVLRDAGEFAYCSVMPLHHQSPYQEGSTRRPVQAICLVYAAVRRYATASGAMTITASYQPGSTRRNS